MRVSSLVCSVITCFRGILSLADIGRYLCTLRPGGSLVYLGTVYRAGQHPLSIYGLSSCCKSSDCRRHACEATEYSLLLHPTDRVKFANSRLNKPPDLPQDSSPCTITRSPVIMASMFEQPREGTLFLGGQKISGQDIRDQNGEYFYAPPIQRWRQHLIPGTSHRHTSHRKCC